MISLLGLYIFLTGSCCNGESSFSRFQETKAKFIIKTLPLSDTIYSISYPYSNVSIHPNSNAGELLLSEANDFTTIFISRKKGYDTIVVAIIKKIEYDKGGPCDGESIKIISSEPRVLSCTCDTAYFHLQNYYYNGFPFDSLIVD